jgi:hypothetical protein
LAEFFYEMQEVYVVGISKIVRTQHAFLYRLQARRISWDVVIFPPLFSEFAESLRIVFTITSLLPAAFADLQLLFPEE